MVALKRASRRPPLIANTIAAIQPPLFNSCNCQKYRIRPGATPKLTKSARLSSSAPNFDWPLIMRATRPSMPSSTAANTIAATANSIRPSVDSKPEIGQDCLACDRGLTFGDQRLGAFGQVDVEPRPEADQPETLSCGDRLSFANERYDPPRHQACDLDHADASIRRRDDK